MSGLRIGLTLDVPQDLVDAVVAAAQASTSPSPAAPTGTKARPGLVQNWPDPRAIDAARPSPMAGPRSSAAAGVTTRGFTLPSSP